MTIIVLIINVELVRCNRNFPLIVWSGLVFSEYLLSGQVPPVKEVNDVEPLFPAVPYLNVNSLYKVSSIFLVIWLIIILP